MIFLEADGIRFEGFTTAKVKKSLNEVAGAFNFTATASDASNFPIQRRAFIKVFVKDTVVVKGFVDQISVSYSNNSHSITISGRDQTSVLVDSGIKDSKLKTYNAPINLKQIIETLIKSIGLGIDVIDNTDGLEDFKKEITAETDETIFMFIERYARKQNVMLTTDFDGNIILNRGFKESIQTILKSQKDAFNNNILSAEINYDDSQRFHDYIVFSQQVEDDDTSNENQSGIKGEAIDLDALTGKTKVIILEQEGAIQDCINRAEWEANIRRAKSVRYNCVVQGFEHDDDFWQIGTIVRVVDDFAVIDSNMLINDVEYDYGVGSGSFTNLSLISPDAYELKPSSTAKDEQLGSLGW